MRRTVKTAKAGEDRVKYTVQLLSEPCLAVGPESSHRQLELLRAMSDRWDLCACGPVPFQRMTMRHDGTCWIVEMTAIADKL